MSNFKQVTFTLNKEQDIYIDEILLADKKTGKRQFPNGRSEYIRKLINDDMNKLPVGKCVLDNNGFNTISNKER